MLALPKSKGFNTTIYVVPAVALAIAAALLAAAARRWRRELPPTATGGTEPGNAAAEQLNSDMDRYDL